MKTTVLISGVAAVLMSANAMAVPKLVDYFNVSMGYQDVDVPSFDPGLAVFGSAGKRVTDRFPNLSAEVEMSKTIDEPGFEQAGTSVNTDIFSLGGYAVYNWPATQKFSMRGKGGLLYNSFSTECNPACPASDDDDFNLSYGLGATWKVDNNFNLLGEYTIVDTDTSDISNLSVGFKYDF